MKNILCVANFKKLHIFVMTFLLMFALCINSFALTTTDDSTDLLGRKSILLTVERENKDYFSDKKNNKRNGDHICNYRNKYTFPKRKAHSSTDRNGTTQLDNGDH